MYGTNPVASQMPVTGKLLVNDIFYTIQGEGPDAGRPAVFLRLSKCNLRCWFCDTEFETGTWLEYADVVVRVLDLAKRNKCPLLVITGGEPLLQQFLPVVHDVNKERIDVSIETAGTLWLDGLEQYFDSYDSARNKIVCSPKTPKLNDCVAFLVHSFKYIVRAGEIDDNGFPTRNTQRTPSPNPSDDVPPCRPLYINPARIYLQPMDEAVAAKTKRNAEAAAAACMKHGYRLSLQTHKYVGLP